MGGYERWQYDESKNPMALDEPEEGRCSEPIDKGYCARWPSVDEDGEIIDGKCSFHSDRDDSLTPTEARSTHNLYSWRSNYYYGLDRKSQIWIDLLIENFLDDAPFDRESLGKLELLRQACIDIHKIRDANEYIWNEGLAQIREVYDKQEGEVKEIEDENLLNLPIDRLQRQVTKRLKELGIIGQEKDAAESLVTLVELLSDVEEQHEEYEQDEDDV